MDKVTYWLALVDEDVLTAKAMLKSKRLLPMGFFCHLAVEKSLKAVIAKNTDDVPPRIHNLLRLADQATLTKKLSETQINLLERLNPMQIEARYPDYKNKVASTLTMDICEKMMVETEAFLCWIKKQLGK